MLKVPEARNRKLPHCDSGEEAETEEKKTGSSTGTSTARRKNINDLEDTMKRTETAQPTAGIRA